jgi:hypothetical protein
VIGLYYKVNSVTLRNKPDKNLGLWGHRKQMFHLGVSLRSRTRGGREAAAAAAARTGTRRIQGANRCLTVMMAQTTFIRVTGMKYALTSYATRLQNETIPRGPLHKLEV